MKKSTVLLSVLLICISSFAQTWEHLTPIKSTDRLKCGFVVNDSTAYIAGFFGNMIKTSDAGDTWSQVHDVTGYPITGGIWGMHFTNINTGYAPDDAGRIYKTTDASASWNQIWSNAGSIFYDIYFTSADTGYVCGEYGEIFKTTNAGASWSPLTSGASTRLYDFSFISSNTGFIAMRDGNVLTTTDAGANWSTINTGNTNDLIHIDFVNTNLGIAVGLQGTILRTTDGGTNWNVIPSGVTSRLSGVLFLDANTVLVNGDNGVVLRSINGGASFTSIGTPTSEDLWATISFTAGTAYTLGDEIVMESFNQGQNWQPRLTGVPESQLMRMVFTTPTTVHAVGRNAMFGNPRSAILRSLDKGRTWATTYSSTSSTSDVTDISFVDQNNGYASAYNTFRKTTDGGATNWSYLNESGYFTAIHFFDINTGLAGNTLDGIFRTTDGGNNWTQVHSCPDVNHFFFFDNDTGYAATDGAGIYKTTDGGLNWVAQNGNATFNFTTVTFANDSVGYILGDFSSGRKTTDYGNTWSPIGFNAFGRDLHFPDPTKADSGFALTANGEVRLTIDGGNSWVTVVPSLNNMILWDFVFIDGYVYACGDQGDILRSKIPCANSYATLTPTACDNYTAPDAQTYSTSGFYVATLTNYTGCDSIIGINLTVNSSSIGDTTATTCDNFTWYGNTYTSSGTPTHILTNSMGCDSTVTLNLTINSSSIGDTAVVVCDSFTWYGNTYTTSGTPTHTLTNTIGCDSVVTLNLTVNSADTSVTQTGLVLTSNASGATYQWLDCNNNFAPINGETGQNMTVSANGNYAVAVTVNGCTDTSACYAINNVSVLENTFKTVPKIYPVPTTGNLTLELDQAYSDIRINVTSTTGQLVATSNYYATRKIDLEVTGAAGLYLIEIITLEGATARLKVLKTNP